MMKNKISDRSSLMLLNRTSVILGALAITAISLAVGYFLGYKTSSLSNVNETQTIIDSRTPLQPPTPSATANETKNPEAPVLSIPPTDTAKPILVEPTKNVDGSKSKDIAKGDKTKLQDEQQPSTKDITASKETSSHTSEIPANTNAKSNVKDIASNAKGKHSTQKSDKNASKTYTIQLGAFPQKDAALALQNKLQELGIKTYITEKTNRDPYYKVRTGAYKNKKDAEISAVALQSKTGLPNFITHK